MRRYIRAVIGLFMALALSLSLFGVALAGHPTPVVTTPTPTPLPTATPTALGLMQESGRSSLLIFLPLAGLGMGTSMQDINPDRFTYVVQPGDTLWSLALDFGRDLDTMACATTPIGSDVENLVPGQEITVPALNDLCYTVVPGDTLASIAARYGLTVETIVAVPWNGFTSSSYTVVPKQRVLLPGARPSARPRPKRATVSYATDSWARSAYPDWPFGDGQFIWPVEGPISQYARPGHQAIDIAVPVGTPVKAADRGTVVMAGWSPVGYGFRVVIDHGIDYVTLYAHLSDIYVEVGQVVGKGQVIGLSGANGNVTGPHLHFEIRDFGILTDPLLLLPQ